MVVLWYMFIGFVLWILILDDVIVMWKVFFVMWFVVVVLVLSDLLMMRWIGGCDLLCLLWCSCIIDVVSLDGLMMGVEGDYGKQGVVGLICVLMWGMVV